MAIITSPCIKQCCLDSADICLGCGRSLTDILQWAASSESEKQRMLTVARERKRARDARLSGYFTRHNT